MDDKQLPLLSLEHAKKSFGETEVLKDISLSVMPCEVVAIIGPSGGGKSTLLRCTTLLETLDGGSLAFGDVQVARDESGRAVYAGKDVVKRAKERFGLVFQDFNLFPHYTVLKNVMDAPVSVLKRPRAQAEEHARALLAKMGLSGKEDMVPCELSFPSFLYDGKILLPVRSRHLHGPFHADPASFHGSAVKIGASSRFRSRQDSQKCRRTDQYFFHNIMPLFSVLLCRAFCKDVLQLQSLLYVSLHLQLLKGNGKDRVQLSVRNLSQCLRLAGKYGVPVIVFVGLYMKLSVLHLHVEDAFTLSHDIELEREMLADIRYIRSHEPALYFRKKIRVCHFLFLSFFFIFRPTVDFRLSIR